MATETRDPIARLNERAAQMKTEADAREALGVGKTRLVLGQDATSAFFASLALGLRYEADWSVDTAATDGRRIIYNPEFALSLSRDEMTGLLAHEVMHIASGHVTRRAGRDGKSWNIACDLAINPLLIAAGMQLPTGGLIPGQPPYRDLPPGLCAEEYYALLPDPSDQSSDDGSGPRSDPGRCGGVDDPTDDEGQPLDQAGQSQLETDIQISVAMAHESAKRRGELGAAIDRLVAATLAPSVDWREQLREYVVASRRDYSWARPNRRQIHRGLYLPSLRSMTVGDIVAAVDTSGSISVETLTRFASELESVARLDAASITIIYHDSEVVRVDRWTPDDGPLTLTPCGGGGTDHRPVFDWLDADTDNVSPPAVVLCLTDLQSVFPPTPPDCPVVWVSTDPSSPHPWGDRIDIAT